MMIDKNDFLTLMVETGNVYSVDVSKGQMRAYYEMLGQYSLEDLQKAFQSHARTSEWFPKVSQVIAAIEGTGKEKSADAWASVMIQIRKEGAGGSPKLSPEIMDGVNKIGGWKAVCAMTYKELDFKAREFSEVYCSPGFRGPALGYSSSNLQLVSK